MPGAVSNRASFDGARLGTILVLGGCVGFTLALGLWRIDCPGLHYDEVFFVAGWSPLGAFEWRPNGLPLMQISYLGAVKTWLYWPVANHLSPALIRVPPLLAAGFSIFLAYCATRRLAGRVAALLAAVILAFDPAFIFLQRLDWGPVALGALFRIASFLLLVQWRDQGGWWRLPLAAFLIGLGLYDKVIFAWYVVALGAALVATRDHWPRPSARVVLFSALSLALGAGPLIAYNVVSGFATLHSAVLDPRQPLAVLLPTHLNLIADTFGGRRLYEMVNRASLQAPIACPGLSASWAASLCGRFPLDSSWFPMALAVAFLLVFVLRPLREDTACRILGLLVAVTAAVFMPIGLGKASGVATELGPHHAAMLLPFAEMFVAVVGVRAARQGWAWRVPIGLGLVIVLMTSAAVSVRTAASFAGTCGRGGWSPAIYQARDFVQDHAGDRILLGDWGFYCQLRVLAPHVPLDDVSWELQRDDLEPARLQPTPGLRTFLLLHRRDSALFTSARRRALGIIRRSGWQIRRTRTLRDLDGRPTADVVEILPGMKENTPS